MIAKRWLVMLRRVLKSKLLLGYTKFILASFKAIHWKCGTYWHFCHLWYFICAKSNNFEFFCYQIQDNVSRKNISRFIVISMCSGFLLAFTRTCYQMPLSYNRVLFPPICSLVSLVFLYCFLLLDLKYAWTVMFFFVGIGDSIFILVVDLWHQLDSRLQCEHDSNMISNILFVHEWRILQCVSNDISGCSLEVL